MNNLAKINFNKNEEEDFKQYMESLLDYLKVLDEVDINVTYAKVIDFKNSTIKKANILRDDELESSLHQETILKNAPSKKDGYFTVPNALSTQSFK